MVNRISTATIRVFLTVATILAICLCFINSPATISSSELSGYFEVTYDPAVFSKTEVTGNETFDVTIHGNATCIKEPSLHPSKGRATGNITAIHTINDTQVILQSSYVVDIEPFPSHLNDSVEMTVTVPLQFPAYGDAGQYSVIAQTIKAEAWLFNNWTDVTDMVPASELIGTVNYTPQEAPPTPAQVYFQTVGTQTVDAPFDVQVLIDNISDLLSAQFDIQFNSSILQVTIPQISVIGGITSTDVADSSMGAGLVRVIVDYATATTGNGVDGSGYLCVLNFSPIAEGASQLNFVSGQGAPAGELILGNSAANEITPVDWIDNSVTVLRVTPPPTPCPATPGTPSLASPTNSAAVSNLTPILGWTTSANATNYSLQISNSPRFTTTLINQSGITNTSYAIQGGSLNWGKTYYWRVNAINCGGNSSWSARRSFKTPTGPTPDMPSYLNASATSSSQINLTWQDNSSNETGFKIERKTGAGGTYSQIATVSANVTTYSSTGLAANTTYCYRIYAYNRNGNSQHCTEASARTLPPPPPAPVLTSPENRAAGINQTPSLAWNPSTGAVNYSVQISTSSTFATTVVNQSGVNDCLLDVSPGVLNWNTRYYWRVNAVGDSGSASAWSTAMYFTTALGPPPADPSSLTATTTSSSQINLAWQDNSNNEAGFKIERKTGTGGTYSQIATVSANVTTYSNTRLTANTTYYYRIVSHSAAGNSNYCAEANATTLPLPPPSPILTYPANKATGINQTPSLAWNPSTGAVNYSVQISTSSTFATTVVNQSGVTDCLLDISPGVLNWSTRYYWRVNTIGNSGSASAWSRIWFFKTGAGP